MAGPKTLALLSFLSYLVAAATFAYCVDTYSTMTTETQEFEVTGSLALASEGYECQMISATPMLTSISDDSQGYANHASLSADVTATRIVSYTSTVIAGVTGTFIHTTAPLVAGFSNFYLKSEATRTIHASIDWAVSGLGIAPNTVINDHTLGGDVVAISKPFDNPDSSLPAGTIITFSGSITTRVQSATVIMDKAMFSSKSQCDTMMSSDDFWASCTPDLALDRLLCGGGTEFNGLSLKLSTQNVPTDVAELVAVIRADPYYAEYACSYFPFPP